MWRSFSIALIFFILAQTANATPFASFNEKVSIQHVEFESQTNVSSSSTGVKLSSDDNYSDNLINIPRFNQACASSFTNDRQTTPNYSLVIEFFVLKRTVALFKHLTNPPQHVKWFEKHNKNSNSNRLSGWKDSNLLYTARLTYHS